MMLRSIIFLAALFAGAQAQALTAAEAKAIATGDTDARIAALRGRPVDTALGEAACANGGRGRAR